MMQLKQENEDLRIELQVVQERESKHCSISQRECSNPTTNDEMTHKRILMQCSGAAFSVGIFACNSGVPEV
jgi:hypothetical protein